MRKYDIALVLLLICTLVLPSCIREKNTLDKTTRQMIEGLARLEMVRLDDSLKRICDSIYQTEFQRTKDSLYAIRQHEIQQIIQDETR